MPRSTLLPKRRWCAPLREPFQFPIWRLLSVAQVIKRSASATEIWRLAKRKRMKGRYEASAARCGSPHFRSEEHTSELQSLMRHSYAVFVLKKKIQHDNL